MTFLESLNLNFSRKWQESFSKPFETNMNTKSSYRKEGKCRGALGLCLIKHSESSY